MQEVLQLGSLEVGGKINVENVSFHCLEIGGNRVYECQLILDINMIINDSTNINHLSKLRWKINDDKVEELKKNGFIKIQAL
jgi:hypothetical protein